ncbi:hypothetical protein [Methanoregula sp.]|uniref:hypothetical protein n=1 Tax=Methanoregula sp. TaxID=2052170 RepID=UPI003C494108
MRKNHTVSLEEEDVQLAQALGLTNLSDYVRNAISYFISGSDRELTPSEIRELSKKLALEKRAELQKQQKITGQSDEEKQKIEDLRAKRLAKIIESVKIESSRVGFDRFKRYLDDPHGDYVAIQDDIIEAVSNSAGFPVDLADVVQAFRQVSA